MELLGEIFQPGGSSCPKCGEQLQVMDRDGESETRCDSCGYSYDFQNDTTLLHRQVETSSTRNVAHFELVEVLGRGSFGSVWLANDTDLGRQVALKLPRVVADRSMVLHEAKTAAKLNHPNIVTIYEVGLSDDQVFIACEYIQGKTLAMTMIPGRLEIDRVVYLLVKLAAAAAHAHDEGVIHRDLKPSNVLLNTDGEPIIADFGIAKEISTDETISSEGAIVGTVGYMSPEQARGQTSRTDHRADIYALGVMMFEMLSGSLPFRGNVQAVIRQKSEDEPPSPRRLVAEIPADLETICLKCLERERGRRYQTARELEEELERYRENRPILARPISTWERGLRWCRRQPVVAGLLAGIVLSLSVGLASSSFFWLRAEDNASMTREELYRSQLNLASVRWANGDLKGVGEIIGEDPVPTLARESDDFSYRYFRSALTPILQSVNHGEPLSDVAVSHDGAYFASAEKSDIVRVWDSRNGSLVRTLQVATGKISSIEFAPSSNRLASSHEDGRVRIWNPVMHDRVIKELNHGPGLSVVRFVPDGSRIVSTGGAGGIQVWNVDMRRAAIDSHERIPYQGKVVDARVTRDGSRLAVACADGRISIFDLQSREVVQDLPEYRGVLCLSFVGDDNSTLAASSRIADTRIYSIDSGEIIRTWKGNGAIGDSEYLYGIQRLALASSAKTLKMYDEQFRERNSISTHIRTYGLLAQSADGKALVAGSDDGTVNFLDISALQQPSILWHEASVRDVVFLSNNRIASCAEDGTVIAWDLDSDENQVLQGPTTSTALALSVIDSGSEIAVAGTQRSVDFFDTEPSENESSSNHSTPLTFPNIVALDYHSEANLVAVGGRNGWVQVYRRGAAAGDDPIWDSRPADVEVHDLCFSAELNRLIIAYSNRTVAVVDFSDGQFRETLIPLEKVPTSIISYAGGQMIAAGTKTGEILLITMSRDAPIRTIKCHGSRINAVAVLPNETQIVTGGMDRDLHLWDISSGKQVATFWGHKRQIFSIAVSPDGQTIVSAGLEGDLRVWRGPYGEAGKDGIQNSEEAR